MNENLYIIILGASSTRDLQINRRDDSDENYDDWFADIVLDRISAPSLKEALIKAELKYEINPDKLYGYRIY